MTTGVNRLGAQGDVEVLPSKPGADVPIRVPTFVLIENDKLDIRYVGHQAGLGLADDPGEPRLRPGILNRTQDRQRMAGIADMGQAYYAYTFWWRLAEHDCEPESLTMLQRGERD